MTSIHLNARSSQPALSVFLLIISLLLWDAGKPAHGQAAPQTSSFEACIQQSSSSPSASQSAAYKMAEQRSANFVCFERFRYASLLAESRSRVRLFESQVPMTYMLLAMVIILTLSGVALATIQLRAAIKLAKASEEVAGRDTTISLETGKASVTSSYVGLAILFLSFGFFYVFAVNIYDIRELPSQQKPAIVPATGVPQKPPAAPAPTLLQPGGLGPPPGADISKP